MNNDRKRIAATIKSVFYGPEDHGIFTCYITIEAGYTQSFGGLILDKDKKGPDFKRAITRLFRVKELEELIGKQCFVLYSFGEHNEMIEGLETLDGQRFTLTQFSRYYEPKTKSRLERKQEDLEREITMAQERMTRAIEAKLSLAKRYTDWG
jgi:hypothetical protein